MNTKIFDRTSSKLRVQLFATILLVLVPLALFVAAGLYQVQTTRTRIIQERAYDLARTGAARYQNAIDDVRTVLDLFSHVPEVSHGTPEICGQFLTNILRSHAWARGFSLVKADQKISCSTNPAALGFDLTNREWFQESLSRGGYHVSDFVVSKVTGTATTFATMIAKDSKSQEPYALTASLDLAWLDQLAADVGQKHNALVLLLDSKGTIISRYPSKPDAANRVVPSKFYSDVASHPE
nr:cache domain-containing protein [Armatimonadota bacterium]